MCWDLTMNAEVMINEMFLIIDVNECSTNSGSCDVNAICADTNGSRTCTCKSGYQGSGVNCSGKSEEIFSHK